MKRQCHSCPPSGPCESCSFLSSFFLLRLVLGLRVVNNNGCLFFGAIVLTATSHFFCVFGNSRNLFYFAGLSHTMQSTRRLAARGLRGATFMHSSSSLSYGKGFAMAATLNLHFAKSIKSEFWCHTFYSRTICCRRTCRPVG